MSKPGVGFKHLMVAIDDSEAGRNAARFAACLADGIGAELTVLSVFPGSPDNAGGRTALDDLQAMLGREIFARHPLLPLELAVARGVPQVEIPRFAERAKVDLIILGRKSRSRVTRVVLGDTADAVVRRSRLPTLLVPSPQVSLHRMLVALDGTDRGVAVLRTAAVLGKAADLDLTVMTVEPAGAGHPSLPSTRRERLAGVVEDRLKDGTREESNGRWQTSTSSLRVREGDVVEAILAEVEDVGADIVVTGFHPGGPLLVIDQGSVSRRLLHAVPCAVLTVPL